MRERKREREREREREGERERERERERESRCLLQKVTQILSQILLRPFTEILRKI